MNAFDYVNSILYKKENLINDEQTENEYNPYLTNKALSYHRDCVLLSNEMNRYSGLDKEMQFDFLINTVRSKKRPFAKWIKNEQNEDLECVKKYFKVSDVKAKGILRLLSKSQIEKIKEKTDIGGLLRK